MQTKEEATADAQVQGADVSDRMSQIDPCPHTHRSWHDTSALLVCLRVRAMPL